MHTLEVHDQAKVFRMLQIKDSLLPMGKIWFLDFLGMQNISKYVIYSESASERERERKCVKVVDS